MCSVVQCHPERSYAQRCAAEGSGTAGEGAPSSFGVRDPSTAPPLDKLGAAPLGMTFQLRHCLMGAKEL
jgi:hypothetical protein